MLLNRSSYLQFHLIALALIRAISGQKKISGNLRNLRLAKFIVCPGKGYHPRLKCARDFIPCTVGVSRDFEH
jgi:hypothetical protein